MLKGNVPAARRAITSGVPSGVTASTSPLPQLHSQIRPSRHLVDSGKPNPSSTTRVPLTAILSSVQARHFHDERRAARSTRVEGGVTLCTTGSSGQDRLSGL